MGEWLADTLEGAQFVTDRLERARQAPRLVARELRQSLLGALDEADAVIAGIKPDRLAAPGGGGTPTTTGGASGTPFPPRPVIRGGKSRPSTGKP